MVELEKQMQECKKCHNWYPWGEFIWLDGEQLCPTCYQHKRRKYDELIAQGERIGYGKGYQDGYSDGVENERDRYYFS